MTEHRRVLILYADAGFGHRSAANAIAEALQEAHGGSVTIDVVNPLDDRHTPLLLRDVQTEDYDKVVRRLPELYKLGFDASDATVTSAMVEGGLIVLLFEVMRDLLSRYQPDVIVSTYPLYQAPLDAVFTMRRFSVPLISVVTDLATVHRLWFNNMVDLCLVPTPQVRGMALDAGLTPKQVQVSGIPVSPHLVHETRTQAEIRTQLGWRQDLITVLVVGSRRVGNFEEALNVLNHSGLPIQLAVVTGGDEERYRYLQQTEWHTVTHLYDYVTNMPELMHASDLVMSKAGGLVITESLACGLPMILIDLIPGQEIGNAEYVIQGGAGELGQDPVNILEIMCHWLEHGGRLLAERAGNAARLGQPHAAYSVAELAWLAAQHGPYRRAGRRMSARTRLMELLSNNEVPYQG
jgi:1,2-diacylglycerol 3-beta-galactosyltransferase